MLGLPRMYADLDAHGDYGLMAEDMKQLGLRVAFFREAHDPWMSQADLAAQADWSQADISKLETGKVRSITYRRLRLLANALDVTVGQLTDTDPAFTMASFFGPEVVPLLLALQQYPMEFVRILTTFLTETAAIPSPQWQRHAVARVDTHPATPPTTY